MEIAQITNVVHDIDRAVKFHRDTLGLPLLFQAPPSLAFFQVGTVRLMLSPPENPEQDHPGSVLYFRVKDIEAVHRTIAARHNPIMWPFAQKVGRHLQCHESERRALVCVAGNGLKWCRKHCVPRTENVRALSVTQVYSARENPCELPSVMQMHRVGIGVQCTSEYFQLRKECGARGYKFAPLIEMMTSIADFSAHGESPRSLISR